MRGRYGRTAALAAVAAAVTALAALVVLWAGLHPDGDAPDRVGDSNAAGSQPESDDGRGGEKAGSDSDGQERNSSDPGGQEAGGAKEPTESEPSGAGGDRSSDGAPGGAAGNPDSAFPSLDVPSTWVPASSSHGQASREWAFTSTEEVAACAEEILVSMRNSGAVLHSAGYLDLFGNVWGCACALPGQSGSMVATVSAAAGDLTRIDLVELYAADVEEMLP